MQKPDVELVPAESGERRLNFGAVRLHNSHLQSGLKNKQGCGLCSQGLEGITSPVMEAKRPDPKPEVDQGDGGDAERDPAPSPDGGAGNWPDPVSR